MMSLSWTSMWPLFLILLLVPWVLAFILREKPIAKSAPGAWVAFEGDPLASASEILASFWARSKDSPVPYADAEHAVLGLEQRYGIVLPADFRTYLLTVAPAQDYWDEGTATWWAHSRIRNVAEELKIPASDPVLSSVAGSCLFFADYLDWCWTWAICCEPGANYGKVALIGSSDHWVADSFSDFVSAYTFDPMSVH